jgi:hypothetical protein
MAMIAASTNISYMSPIHYSRIQNALTQARPAVEQ